MPENMPEAVNKKKPEHPFALGPRSPLKTITPHLLVSTDVTKLKVRASVLYLHIFNCVKLESKTSLNIHC